MDGDGARQVMSFSSTLYLEIALSLLAEEFDFYFIRQDDRIFCAKFNFFHFISSLEASADLLSFFS